MPHTRMTYCLQFERLITFSALKVQGQMSSKPLQLPNFIFHDCSVATEFAVGQNIQFGSVSNLPHHVTGTSALQD
jgi:hypothetical protein